MRRLTAAAALAGLLATGACSTRGDLERVEETMIAEFREVHERQDSLASEMQELRGAVLDSLAAREGEALGVRGELGRRLDQLREQIGRVSELTGQNQRSMARLREEIAAARGEGAPQGGGGEPAGDGDGAEEDDDADDADRSGDGADEGGSATQLYETALEQFRRGAHGTARSGLREFLSEHPDHELAPDAQYYVAETYARTDSPDEALEAYGRVVELFPGSRRAATALYRSGVLEAERGNLEDARVYFSRVVEGYPDSDEADLARERLEGGGA